MAAKNMDLSKVDDLGVISTFKQVLVAPAKAGLKLTYLGTSLLDVVTTSLYENRDELDGVIRQGTRQGILTVKAGIIGMAKLNKEIGESIGADLNEDIDVLIERVYKEE